MRKLILALMALPAVPAHAVPAAADAPVIAAPSVSVDPARLAIAIRIAEQVMPDGTFQVVMDTVMGSMSKSMVDGMMNMPIQSIAKLVETDPAKIKALGPAKMRDIIAIVDPVFDQRMEITMKVMGKRMGQLMTEMEPTFRLGLAEAYAARFDEVQLGQIHSFFNSPTGSKFAAQLMTTQTDPAFVGKMQHIMPKMMDRMPAMMKEVAEATASLPKAKTDKDLTPADKARIAMLLGVDPAKVTP